MLRTIARNVFSNYVGIAGTVVIAFMLSPFLVHTLGDTKYGIWSIISALTGYMALLDFGVSSAIARFVARFNALKDQRSVNTTIATGLAITIAVGTALVLLAPFIASLIVNLSGIEKSLKETVHTLILIASLDICIFIVTGVLLAAMTGYQRFDMINAVNLGLALFKATSFYLALTNGYGLIAMGIISLCGNSLAGIASIIILRRIKPNVILKPTIADKPTFIRIFHFSKYTFLSMLAMQLVYYSDAFVIGYFMTAAAITYYTIPWSLSEYTNKLTLAIAQTFVPVFSEQTVTSGNEKIYQTYVTGTKFILFVSNLLCTGMLVVGYYFLAIWMGPNYAEKCGDILTIMFITQLIKGPQLLNHAILVATSRQQLFSLLNFSFSILNLILSIILIQRYELLGVAVATAFTQIVFYGIVTPILTSRVLLTKLWPYIRDTFVRSVPSTLVLAISLHFWSEYKTPDGFLILVAQALISATAYALVAYFSLLSDAERTFVFSTTKGFLYKVRRN